MVHSPWKASDSRIEKTIFEAADWIVKKLEEWAGHETRTQRWAQGEQVGYLGRNLTLDIVADAILVPALLADEGRLRITVADSREETRIREAAIAWYRRHAARNFTDRVAHYAPLMQVRTPRMFLSNARTQWGSCNSKTDLRLNWRLIQAPQEVIDYVVVHELAHITEMNHSRRFWNIVERHFPTHMQIRKHLNERGHWYLGV